MKLVRGYAPLAVFNPLAQLERELGQVFGTVPGAGSCGAAAVVTAPPTDVVEDGKQYAFTVELPGVRREDVQVSLEDGVLTISAERKAETAEETPAGSVHLRERFHGRFVRRFTLGSAVSSEGVRATLKDGLLVVIVPKAEAAKARTIEVTAE